MELLNFITQYLHIDNITKSWKTTLIGLMLIIAGFVSKFVPIVGQLTTWGEALLPIVFGVLLCFSQDSPLTPKGGIEPLKEELPK